MNAEEVKVGCFQLVIVFLLGVNYLIVAMSHALPAFHNYTPKFYCEVKNETNRTYGCHVETVSNISIGSNSTSGPARPFSSCSGEYRFTSEFEESSVVTEWNLVCEKRHLSFLGPTVYYFGVLIGAWVAGFLADRIGRLPVQAICLYTQGTMAVALYAVQNYPTFLALRGLQGIFVQGLQNSTYILAVELFPMKARTFVALIMQIFWAVGLVLLAVLSYVIPDWRILQLAVSVPTAITVLYIWIIPESPRWLLAKGKSTEADMALERIAKYNGCCARPQRDVGAKQEIENSETATPVKPERRSRVSSADLKKTKVDDETQEEAANLLSADNEQTRTRKSSMKSLVSNSESRQSKFESGQEVIGENDVEKRNAPSSSKCHRKSRSMSQSISNHRLSLKNAYDIVELRTPTNKEKFSEIEIKPTPEEKANTTENHTLKQMLKCTLLKKYSFIMIIQWLASAMACHAFINLVPNLPVNRHIAFALGGALEIATYTFLYFVLSRYGRRLPLSVYQSFTGLICILSAALVILSTPSFWIDLVKTIVLLFGRVAVMSTISIVYLYTVEIFPTVIRGTCLGLCAVFARIGSLSTPHVLLSGEYMHVAVPLIVIGMLCVVSAGLAVILPETVNKVLPDAIEDAELLIVEKREKDETLNNERPVNEDLNEREILRAKLFSEDWVDAGNGILVNFSEGKGTE